MEDDSGAPPSKDSGLAPAPPPGESALSTPRMGLEGGPLNESVQLEAQASSLSSGEGPKTAQLVESSMELAETQPASLESFWEDAQPRETQLAPTLDRFNKTGPGSPPPLTEAEKTPLPSPAPASFQPVATPARSLAAMGGGKRVSLLDDEEPSDVDIPDLGDRTAETPVPGKIRISDEAIKARMRRIMTPAASGTLKVSQDIVKKWKSKGKARASLEALFQSVGFCKDRVGLTGLLHLKLLFATLFAIPVGLFVQSTFGRRASYRSANFCEVTPWRTS